MGPEASPLECAAWDGQRPQQSPLIESEANSLLCTSSWDRVEAELCAFVLRLERGCSVPMGALASAPPPASPQIPVAFSSPPGPPDS